MSRKKLTLSVEERLTRRAKSIAEKRGTSVSRLVETFFTSLEGPEDVASEDDESQAENSADAAAAGQSADVEESVSPSEGASGKGTSPLTGYEPSEWANRWRGAFRKEDASYPDDTEWEEELLAEEVGKKHA